MHKHEFNASFHRFPSPARPFLGIERRKRPQGLYRRHERTMVNSPAISFLSLAVPASIIPLVFHKPFKHLSDTGIILKPELGKRPRHIAGYTGLPDQTPPAQILIRILWRRPRTILPIHNSQKILTALPNRGIRPGNTHFSQQYQRPDRCTPLGPVHILPISPVTRRVLFLQRPAYRTPRCDPVQG